MTVSNKQLAKAFAAAKEHLSPTNIDSDDKAEYICWALSNAHEAGKISDAVRIAAKRIINERIDHEVTFTDWLRENHPELDGAIEHDYRYNCGRRMQITRRAWLDSLIAEFSQEG